MITRCAYLMKYHYIFLPSTAFKGYVGLFPVRAFASKYGKPKQLHLCVHLSEHLIPYT